MPRIVSVEVGTLEYGRDIQWLGDAPTQVATLVRVRLESGAEGVSVAWNDSPSATTMALAVEAWFAPALIGHDIRNHPAGSESLFQLAAWHATSSVAIAAIDNAMWDAKGQFDRRPVHMLLGTRHDSVPAYAVSREEMTMTSVEEVIDHVRAFEAQGFRGFKPHLWGHAKRDARGCEAIRKAMGDGFDLMFDPMGRYSLHEALEVGKALQSLDYLWFEDPIPGTQRHAYPWLAQRLDIPIVATDALQWSAADYLDAATRQVPAALRLDAGRQGITFCKKIMDVAAHYGVRCEFHSFGPEPNSIAGLHAALAQKPVSYYEACVPREHFEVPGIAAPTRIDANGCITAPTSHGMGLDVDWAYLERQVDWIPRSKRSGKKSFSYVQSSTNVGAGDH